MQFNKVFKGMLIALPMVTLMACTSTADKQAAEDAAEKAKADAAAKLAEEQQALRDAEAKKVEMAALEAKSKAEQKHKSAMDALVSMQTVYFDFDRASVRADSHSTLDKHAEFLSQNPNVSIVIEGHCDSRGTPEYNIALGERRAQSVATYLQNAGVSGSQLTVVSYGEEKPVSNGTTQDAFAKNRRGVLVYQP
jgi:peptidoglycan-associated lipoprotein